MEQRRRIWPWILLGAAVLLLVVRFTVVAPFKIPAGSMIPTLQVGSHVLVNLMRKHPARGDVIVFKYPKEPEKDFIKRVIGVGGDTVEIRAGVVYINGSAIQRTLRDQPKSYRDYREDEDRWEEFKCTPFEESIGDQKWTIVQTSDQPQSFGPVNVPRDSYFVLGDNRDNSHDSRYWGFVPQSHVRGTLIGVWYSGGQR